MVGGRAGGTLGAGLCWAATALIAVLLAATANLAIADPYDEFRDFALTAFTVDDDSLIHAWLGTKLEEPSDWWSHQSERSVVVGFTTNLPAWSYLEYGPTTSYGQQTAGSDRPYHLHLHYLRNLEPGSVYHYRAVTIDEDDRTVYGPDRKIVLATAVGAIRIPEDLPGPPFRLDVPGARYILTEDIDAPRTAFEITAHDVTLDLGGHVVSYDNEPVSLAGGWPIYRDGSSVGVRCIRRNGVRVFNGTLRQGHARSSSHPRASIGFNPVLLSTSADFEIAGVTLDYSGTQMVGVHALYPQGSNEIHHDVFVDRGTELSNRHGTGSKSLAITGMVSTVVTHHNLVKRTRQSALDGGLIHDNEIYIDSYATNSFGIPSLIDGREAYGNRIFGTGYHVVALGWGSNNWWHDNFIYLVGQGPDGRYSEYGDQESLNGIRLTQYKGADVEYADSIVENNLILISGGACNAQGECTQARGLQYSSDPFVTNNLIRHNTIRVVMSDQVHQAAALVTQGTLERCGSESPVRYEGNTLISNIANVRMGDYYGQGCNHRFYGNRMIRVGDRRDYRTLTFDRPVPLAGQYFFDTTLAGGASLDLLEFTGPDQVVLVGWTMTVVALHEGWPVAGARVEFEDGEGEVVARGETDEDGGFSRAVVAYTQTDFGRMDRSQMKISIAKGELQASRVITLAGPTSITLPLE